MDLNTCVAIWTSYKRRAPLTSDEVRAVSIASQNMLRSASLFGAILEVLGGQNGCQKSIFEPFFSMFFLIAFWHRFLVEFSRLRTWKIAIFLRENNDFCKIDVFEKGTKKRRCWLHFRRPERWKFDPKSLPKIGCFSRSNFHRFFRFWHHLGLQKSIKNR